MICKRGDLYCQKIGCDCFETAPIGEIEAELRASGIDIEELRLKTQQQLALIRRNMDLHVKVEQLISLLKTAKQSIELFEKELLPRAESWFLEHGPVKLHPRYDVAEFKFAEWTHYANTLRDINNVLGAEQTHAGEDA